MKTRLILFFVALGFFGLFRSPLTNWFVEVIRFAAFLPALAWGCYAVLLLVRKQKRAFLYGLLSLTLLISLNRISPFARAAEQAGENDQPLLVMQLNYYGDAHGVCSEEELALLAQASLVSIVGRMPGCVRSVLQQRNLMLQQISYQEGDALSVWSAFPFVGELKTDFGEPLHGEAIRARVAIRPNFVTNVYLIALEEPINRNLYQRSWLTIRRIATEIQSHDEPAWVLGGFGMSVLSPLEGLFTASQRMSSIWDYTAARGTLFNSFWGPTVDGLYFTSEFAFQQSEQLALGEKNHTPIVSYLKLKKGF